jgi:hypothetical protein
MANTTTTPDRKALLASYVADARKDAAVAAVADRIAPLGQGEWTPALAQLIREGIPKKIIVQGYMAARLVEMAHRPKYAGKDASHARADVLRHASNHHDLGIRTVFAEQSKAKG